MATYTSSALSELAAGYGEVAAKVEDLMLATTRREYATEDGRLHATQGFMRRVSLLHHCIKSVYDLIPPETDDVPDSSTRKNALVSLHSFSMNTFGCLDNLAWLWCYERRIEIKKSHVGLGPNNRYVRDTLPKDLQEYLSGLENWFENLYEFRHALAHRIPFYIPPYIIDAETIGKYNDIEKLKTSAASAGDFDRYWQLDSEQDALGKFKAVVAQGPIEPRIYYFHPNMLADLATVHEVGMRLMEALDA